MSFIYLINLSPCYKFDKLFLICRNFNQSNSLDPTDYECIGNVTWVVENEPPLEPKLNLEELENMVAQKEGEREEQIEEGKNESVYNIDDQY